MSYLKAKRAIALVLMLTVVGLAPIFIPATRASARDNSSDLPSLLCDSVQVPAGNKVSLRIYGQGIQLYRWNGSGFVEPSPFGPQVVNKGSMRKVG